MDGIAANKMRVIVNQMGDQDLDAAPQVNSNSLFITLLSKNKNEFSPD